MAFKIPKISYNSMMKDGTRNFQGLEEAVFRNIDACKQLAAITRSSYGPNGMKKIILNHFEKLFITKDVATILKELEIEHPAAKILISSAQMAEQDVGDGTNFVVLFASSLLTNAIELLNFGVSPCEIIDGYKHALNSTLKILPSIVCSQIKDIRNMSEIIGPIKIAISTKQIMYADHLANITAKACILAKPINRNGFNVDNVRTVKILGGAGSSSMVVQGLVLKNETEGIVSNVKNAKIVVFNTDFDLMVTETKGTVLINTADELLSFSKEEEGAMKIFIDQLKSIGINVVVCSGKVSDQALDFSNRNNIAVVRVTSKFEIQRLCRATSSTCLATILIPNHDQIGHCDQVYSKEIGETNVVVFSQESEENTVSTIIIRGSSDSLLNDMELAIDDGINCFKSLSQNSMLLPGSGATEMQLCIQLEHEVASCIGLEKHTIGKFCDSLKNIVRCIAENNGLKVNELIPKLYNEHLAGKTNMGIDINSMDTPCDVLSNGILDSLHVKTRCFQLAVDAATTILSIDQIVMSRPAGGPVPRQNPNWDAD